MSEADITVDAGGGRQQRIRVDYPSNAQNKKQEPKAATSKPEKQAPIVTGEVKVRKQSLASRVVHDFVVDDMPSVIQYVVMDVMLPAAKRTIADVVAQGIERMLYGDQAPARGARTGYTSYSSRSRPVDPRPALSRQARATHNFSSLVLSTRAEAENVLETLRSLISQFEFASVANLYELVDQTPDFTDNKWGWYDLRSASIRMVRDGYLLEMPRTEPLA